MSPTTFGKIAFTAGSLALILAAGSCKKPQATQCPKGNFCPEGYQCAKNTAQCITGLCGNDHVDPLEICDDGGNLDGDVIPGETPCSANCQSDESCGNGIRDIGTGEVCDCGVNPLTGVYGCDPATATGCVMDGPDKCMSTGDCGNEVRDGTEQCDQGQAGKPAWGPTCNIDCTTSKCGDGKINPAAPEACDGGNGINGQSVDCNTECTVSKCGDGKKNPLDTRPPNPYRAELDRHGLGEQCDDGGRNNWSLACLPSCMDNVCGDTYTNTSNTNHEECDQGLASKSKHEDCPWSFNDTGCSDLCSECKWVHGKHHYCGDGTTDTSADAWGGQEKCDHGVGNVGNVNDQSNCPYGNLLCDLCGTDCNSERAWMGPVCGDQVKNSGTLPTGGKYQEDCDNAASVVCGTCNPAGDPATQCKYHDKVAAVGWITVNSTTDLAGVVVTVTDGITGPNTLTFEYAARTDIDPATKRVADGNRGIEIADGNLVQTAQNTDDVIGEAFPKITATRQTGSGNTNKVKIANDNPGLDGNQDIVVTNNDANAISVLPMTGGTGCMSGDTCYENRDCVSNNCNAGTHECN